LRRKKDAEKQMAAAMTALKERIRKFGADAADEEQADDDEKEREYLRAYLGLCLCVFAEANFLVSFPVTNQKYSLHLF
jgi:hypothetical protein